MHAHVQHARGGRRVKLSLGRHPSPLSMETFSVPLWHPPQGASYELNVPSSKSLANRMLILTALAQGSSRLKGDFEAEDIQIMITALQAIGLELVQEEGGVRVSNDFSWRSNADEKDLFLGNSGTSTRFLAALCALREGPVTLSGKPRLQERPIGDLAEALKHIGARVKYLQEKGFPPLKISQGIGKQSVVELSGETSSQFITALLMIAPLLQNGLEIRLKGKVISRPYINMTLELMKQWGAQVVWKGESTLVVEAGSYQPQELTIEGDASAAVYWWALSFLHEVEVSVANLPGNSLQGDQKFLQLLNKLKKEPQVLDQDLLIDMEDLPDASLMLMALAPLLNCPVRIEGLSSLRVKETDRLEAMATELSKVGVKVEVGPDWMRIEPLDMSSYNADEPIEIDTYDDHRVAMSIAILGTRLGNLVIRDPDCVNKTYPKFWVDLSWVLGKPE